MINPSEGSADTLQDISSENLLQPCVKSKRKQRRERHNQKQNLICFASNLQGEISHGVHLAAEGIENAPSNCEEPFSEEYFDEDLEYSNWKHGNNFCRSVGKQAKPKIRPNKIVRTAESNKTWRRAHNKRENCLSRKDNNEAKLSKNHIRRFGLDIYFRRCEPNESKTVRKHTKTKSRSYQPPHTQNTVDHPNALKYELKKDSAAKDNSQNLIADLQHRDITPEDYELLLLLDESVAKKTISTSFLAALKCVRVTEAGVVGEACAICMESYTESERVKELPCSHLFHELCIDNWLSNASPNCPLDGVPVQP